MGGRPEGVEGPEEARVRPQVVAGVGLVVVGAERGPGSGRWLLGSPSCSSAELRRSSYG